MALPYDRELLQADGEREVLLLRWRPGIRCAPHDHGQASGVIHLVEGELRERRFRFTGTALELLSEVLHRAPAFVSIAAGEIHDMVSTTGAMTVHRYGPRMGHMRIYDEARRETLVVGEECGAWMPERDEVRRRESWG